MTPMTPEWTTAYLALGGNVGDRLANLRHACDLIEAEPGIVIEARSAIYETQSVEGGGDAPFFNAALRIKTVLDPGTLLARLQAVEVALGRPRPPRQGARPIDIDILIYGDRHIDEPGLHVPHPRMWRRAFVLRPLCDVLEGGWIRPAEVDWN